MGGGVYGPFNGPLLGTTRVSQYQKGRTSLELATVSGSCISWAICKSAPRSRQITTPAPHHSVFTGRMPFLPPNQQLQSTEGSNNNNNNNVKDGLFQLDFGTFLYLQSVFFFIFWELSTGVKKR